MQCSSFWVLVSVGVIGSLYPSTAKICLAPLFVVGNDYLLNNSIYNFGKM
jgi:hypothetical protein